MSEIILLLYNTQHRPFWHILCWNLSSIRFHIFAHTYTHLLTLFSTLSIQQFKLSSLFYITIAHCIVTFKCEMCVLIKAAYPSVDSVSSIFFFNFTYLHIFTWKCDECMIVASHLNVKFFIYQICIFLHNIYYFVIALIFACHIIECDENVNSPLITFKCGSGKDKSKQHCFIYILYSLKCTIYINIAKKMWIVNFLIFASKKCQSNIFVTFKCEFFNICTETYIFSLGHSSIFLSKND